MIKVYGSAKTRSARVTWTLEESRLDYDLINVDLLKGEARQLDFLRLNPMAQTPVLVDAAPALSESQTKVLGRHAGGRSSVETVGA